MCSDGRAATTMAAQAAQTLLASMAAHIALSDYGADKDEKCGCASFDSRVEKRQKNTGVEIIVNSDDDENLASVAYPHFNDRPENAELCHSTYPVHHYPTYNVDPGGLIGDPHALYPAYPTYPVYDHNSSGLVGEKKHDNARISHDGIEIIWSDDDGDMNYSSAVYPSAVYPHFEDRPSSNGKTHTVYPSYCIDHGGLIGESGKRAHVAYPIYNHGYLIGAKNSEASREHSINRAERVGMTRDKSTCVAYPGGLVIEEKSCNDSIDTQAVLLDSGAEALAIVDSASDKHAFTIYPYFGDPLGGGNAWNDIPRMPHVENSDCGPTSYGSLGEWNCCDDLLTRSLVGAERFGATITVN